MQSFLQYRRFNKRVTRQYERDKDKAEALGHHHSYDSSKSTSPSTSSRSAHPSPAGLDSTADTRDLEKAEHSNGGVRSESEAEQGPTFQTLVADSADREERPAPISRVSTAATQRTLGTNLGTTLTGIDVRNRTTREGGDRGKVFVVGYEGERDDMNPHNWPFLTRLRATYEIVSGGRCSD